VPVAEANILAKAHVARRWRRPFRDALLARPALLGRAAAAAPGLANGLLRNSFVRRALEQVIGLSAAAPLPAFAKEPYAPRLGRAAASSDNAVAYFSGCSTQFYEPWIGEATEAVLRHVGLEVLHPEPTCCGLPLQSNGYLGQARAYATATARALAPSAGAGIPIVATSTSCSLSIKHDYRAVLGLSAPEFAMVALSTWDVFEFLSSRFESSLARMAWNRCPRRALYHPPCQLRSHAVGAPAIEMLRRIPGLELRISASECCGVAGTYGLKAEKYAVARRVGEDLFRQIRGEGAEFVVTDSETCRWWIRSHTNVPALHPIQVLAAGLGLAREGL
jgi:glycerol-3-phosphate dehydrogenase subunit C